MGQDLGQSMQTPTPMQQNLARGMDPTQGAIGADGAGQMGGPKNPITPATPDLPIAQGLNPGLVATGAQGLGGNPSNSDTKNLIAQLLARISNRR